MRHTLKAYERLKREQDIDTLFRIGKAFSIFPLRFIFHLVPLREGDQSPIRVGFSVPKRKFKKAVDRNRIKRLMRESWRLNKHHLSPIIPIGFQLHVFLIFTDNVLVHYKIINDAVLNGIEKFPEKINK